MSNDQPSFKEWLYNRQKVPPFSILFRLRQIHQDNNLQISIYSVQAIIDTIKEPELDIGIFKLTVYLHNQYYPILEEIQIAQLLEAYERFEPEPNTCYTYEAILAQLSKPLGIKSKIRKSKCLVCLESLGWHDPFLGCGHVYHRNCMPASACYICKI